MISLHVNGKNYRVDVPDDMPLPLGHKRLSKTHGHEVWLWHWRMWGMYGPH